MTDDSGNVTSDSGKLPKIGHDKTECAVTIIQNRRSRSNGMGGHDGPEYALLLPAFEHAERNALSNAEMIVAGQPRSDVRHWIDRYRCDLFFGLELDTQNVIFDCYRWGEKVHEAFNR